MKPRICSDVDGDISTVQARDALGSGRASLAFPRLSVLSFATRIICAARLTVTQHYTLQT